MSVHSAASGFVPTGDDGKTATARLTWRGAYPGEWRADFAGYIWADSLKGGDTTPAQVRGWGYLTGRGEGALSLDEAAALEIQRQVGALLAAAPDYASAADKMIDALGMAPDEVIAGAFGDDVMSALTALRAARAKALGTQA